MKIRTIVLSLCAAVSVNSVFAQSKFTPSENKHEFRISISDGTPMTMTDIFGNAFSDAVLGSKRTDEKILGVFGLGYRYAINRFKVGGDLGFGIASSKLAFAGQTAPSIKERDIHFLVMPTAEFSYFRRGLVELYGSAAAGVDLKRHSESGLTPKGKEMASAKSDFGASFAYQVNPIAVRVGNDRIGGFVEAGFGTKGFVTAGISLGF